MFVAPELLGGRYEVRGILGRGGMAEVREGWDTQTGQTVAIKLLYPGFDTHPDYLRRFWAEAQSAAALRHPNIVAVYGSGEHNGTPFIVMERLPGNSLGDLIAQGPVPAEQVRRMLDSVLSALATAHAAGVLHRDIKPANILFTPAGEAQVADFGLAKGPDTHRTDTGRIMGTMAYMSPERLTGNPATVADDLYAVGVVGYEALTGRRAFPEENLVALAHAITENPPPPVSVLRPDVSPQLAAIIDRAMAHDAAHRFASAEAMRAELANLDGDPVTGPIPVPWVPHQPVGSPWNPGTAPVPALGNYRRTRWFVVLVVALFVAVLVAVIAFAFGASTQRSSGAESSVVTTSVGPHHQFPGRER